MGESCPQDWKELCSCCFSEVKKIEEFYQVLKKILEQLENEYKKITKILRIAKFLFFITSLCITLLLGFYFYID